MSGCKMSYCNGTGDPEGCTAHYCYSQVPGLKVVPGEVFGYYLETDDFVLGATHLGYQPFDMKIGRLGQERFVRYSIDIHKYRDEIHKAIRTVALMNLPVEKITIMKGVVQAHPPIKFHWRCPFCYPENAQ